MARSRQAAKPPLILQSPLTGQHYVATSYTVKETHITAHTKYEVTDRIKEIPRRRPIRPGEQDRGGVAMKQRQTYREASHQLKVALWDLAEELWLKPLRRLLPWLTDAMAWLTRQLERVPLWPLKVAALCAGIWLGWATTR